MRRDVPAMRNTLLCALALLAGCAGTVRAPYPPIQADTSPEAVARGAAIFHASCEACHRGGDAETVSGAPLRELPSFMGRFHAANLTSDPGAGIGAVKDEELARAIRYAVSRDGRLMVMPSYGMGDADVAAVLGFMRSGDPLFAPDPTPAPRSEFSVVGGLGFRVITGNEPPERPASGIPVPPKGPTREYGRYMAHEVYDCAACHTDGFSPDKTRGEDVFSGGMTFVDPEGQKVRSSNITFDATGLANWTLEDFTRALRDGLAPDGSALRSPMPRFRALDEAEARALYDYLRSVPPRRHEVKGARPRLTASSPRAAWVAASEVAGAGATATTGGGAMGTEVGTTSIGGMTPPVPGTPGAALGTASARDVTPPVPGAVRPDMRTASARDVPPPVHGTGGATRGAADVRDAAPAAPGIAGAKVGASARDAAPPAPGIAGTKVGTASARDVISPAPPAPVRDTRQTPPVAVLPTTPATGDAVASGATAEPPTSPVPGTPPGNGTGAPVRGARPTLTPAKVDAAKLFVRYGCAGCHAPGARYHDRLARAASRSDLDLVRWVRNPEKYLPGTPMPTYAELIDERTALALVRWLKAGGAAKIASK